MYKVKTIPGPSLHNLSCVCSHCSEGNLTGDHSLHHRNIKQHSTVYKHLYIRPHYLHNHLYLYFWSRPSFFRIFFVLEIKIYSFDMVLHFHFLSGKKICEGQALFWINPLNGDVSDSQLNAKWLPLKIYLNVFRFKRNLVWLFLMAICTKNMQKSGPFLKYSLRYWDLRILR